MSERMTQRWSTERLAEIGVSEETLVDWIDGVLSPEQERQIASLPQRAELEAWVAGMRQDSGVLRAIPAESAPAGLADSVLSRLESDVLATIGRQATHQGAVPVRLPGSSAASNPFGVRYAMAAAVLLAASLGVWFIARHGNSPVENPAEKKLDIALDGSAANGNHVADESGLGTLAASTATVATATGPVSEPLVRREATVAAGEHVAALPMSSESLSKSVKATSSPAVADSSSTPRRLDDPSRVLALAKEGRLVVRVRAKDTRSLAQLEKQGRADSANAGWKLRTQVPPAVLAAVIPPAPTRRDLEGVPSRMLASSDRPSSMIAGMMGMMPTINIAADDPLARVRGTYLVEFAGTDKALTSVRSMFAGRLRGEVEFEELPEPLNLTPAATPEGVLWWTQPASEWAPKVVVPLVVEQG
jgi:hypothetical protein